MKRRSNASLLFLAICLLLQTACTDKTETINTTFVESIETESTEDYSLEVSSEIETEVSLTEVTHETYVPTNETEEGSTELNTENAIEITKDYTVTETSCTKYAKQTVNVRSGASTDYAIIGSLALNEEVIVTGIASTEWYRINYHNMEGYVSNHYLVDEIIMQATNSTSEISSSNNDNIIEQMATALNNDDYILLSSLAEQYDSYSSSIEQYIIKTKENAKYYHLPSSIGTIVMGFGDSPSYGYTIVLGMCHNDINTGTEAAEYKYQTEMAGYEVNKEFYSQLGIGAPEKREYGVDMFMEGDEFIIYHYAKYINGFKYTEIYINGIKYDSINQYQGGHSSGPVISVGF